MNNLDLALALLPLPEPDPVPEVVRMVRPIEMEMWLGFRDRPWPMHDIEADTERPVHPFALLDYHGNVTVRCHDCGTYFAVTRSEAYPGKFVCQCPECAGDAASEEDGIAPPCGYGKTRLEAAQDWSDNQ